MGPGLGGDNKTIAAALLGTLKPNVQALITGHQHVFEALSYTQDIPVALISGHGGDDLALKVPKDPVGLTINGMTIKAGIARPGIFGFSLLERVPDGSGNWRFTGFDVQGQKIGSCLMNGRSLECG
jgi:hypothetical protein